MCIMKSRICLDALLRSRVRYLVWCAKFFATLLISVRAGADEVGIPWSGPSGVTESVSEIMARQKNLPLQSVLQPAQSDQGRLVPNRKNLAPYSASPRVSHFPSNLAPA